MRCAEPLRRVLSRRTVVTRAAQAARQLRREEERDSLPSLVGESPKSGYFYPVGRRAFRFDDLPAETGLQHGDRVRAFAGRYTGRLGLVIGMRGGAVWIHFAGEASAEGLPLQQLPRHDVRIVGQAVVDTLPADQYADGDEIRGKLLYTAAEAQAEAKNPEILDDASAQHLIDELPTSRPCERCAKRKGEDDVRAGIERATGELGLRERLKRLLQLSSPSVAALSSPEAIANAVAEQLHARAYERAEDGLRDLLLERVGQWDALQQCYHKQQEHHLPVGALTLVSSGEVTTYTLSKEDWARAATESHPGVKAGSYDQLAGETFMGTEVKDADPLPEDVVDRLYYELRAFRGRHREHEPQLAEVWCSDAIGTEQPEFRSLCRCCAVEVYSDVPAAQRPTLFDARGLPSYTQNAWRNPWTLPNPEGLGQFAKPMSRPVRTNQARFTPLSTP